MAHAGVHSGHADRLQHYEMRFPSLAVNMGIYTPAGKGGPDMVDDADTYRMISYHFLTPIDEDNTRYFWLQHRNTDPHNKAISEKMNAGARMAFEEDRAVLEHVHLGMKNPTKPSIDLGLDVGAKLFRLMLSRKIEAEKAA